MRVFRRYARLFVWLAIIATLGSALPRAQAAAGPSVVHDDVLGAMVICAGQIQTDDANSAAVPPHCPACIAPLSVAELPLSAALAVRIAFAIWVERQPSPPPPTAQHAPTELGSRAPPHA
jgi:hypothetical protein